MNPAAHIDDRIRHVTKALVFSVHGRCAMFHVNAVSSLRQLCGSTDPAVAVVANNTLVTLHVVYGLPL